MRQKMHCYLVSNRKVGLIDFAVNTLKHRCPACLFIKDLILTVYLKLLIMKVVCIFFIIGNYCISITTIICIRQKAL